MRRVAGILFAVVFFQMTAMALVFQDDDCVPGQRNDCNHRMCGPFCSHCDCCAQVGSVIPVNPGVVLPQPGPVEYRIIAREPITGFRADILHVPR